MPALRTASRTGRSGALRLRRALVVTQVTASLILLVGAGLLLRSTASALEGDLGFVPDRIAVVSKNLSFDGYAAADATVVFEEMAATLAAHPDVEAVALATNVERVFDDLTVAHVRPDTSPPGDEPLRVRLNAVDPAYMSVLGMTVVRGRMIADGDRQGAERVALVNEAFAARHWPGASPIGRTVRLEALEEVGHTARGLDDLLTVVGVVRDPVGPGSDASRELGVSGLVAVNAKIWVPLAQHPSTSIVIHARARDTAASIVPLLRARTGTEDVPLIAAQPLEQLVSLPLAIPRAAGRVMRWAGAFALVLSFLGIYGIVSFAVTQRSREMAIRRAIGARSDQIIGSIMRHGVVLAVWGIALGLSVTAPLAVLLRSELAGVHPLDPVAVGGGVGVILLAALLASGIPARRLARLDPMAVLRDE